VLSTRNEVSQTATHGVKDFFIRVWKQLSCNPAEDIAIGVCIRWFTGSVVQEVDHVFAHHHPITEIYLQAFVEDAVGHEVAAVKVREELANRVPQGPGVAEEAAVTTPEAQSSHQSLWRVWSSDMIV
jgi:hypothetical protein